MAWAVDSCFSRASVPSITLPLMLAELGVIGVFCFYAGMNIVAFIMIVLWLPETNQRTLEELDYIFAVPTHIFTHYQLTKVLPWWFKRWVLFNKDAVLEELFQFDDAHPASSDNESDTAKVVEKDSTATTTGAETSPKL